MLINLLSKIGLSCSAVSGICFVNSFSDEIISRKTSKLISNKIIQNENIGINSIEDIELFERVHGCSFVYSNDQNISNLYTARGFEEQEKEEVEWKNKSFQGGHGTEAREWCKRNKGIVTLFRDGGDFRMGNPLDGW